MSAEVVIAPPQVLNGEGHMQKRFVAFLIAEHRRTSVATARTQLKALMAKIGASKQSDVVRAVLAISVLDPK